MASQTPRIPVPINVNAPALSLPGSDQIRGVLIDNPSGAWLMLRTTNEFIPPYTIGFARSFEYGHTSIAIEWAATGPAGQISTLAGEAAAVQLFSDPVGNSSGNSSGGKSFIEQFTPVIYSFDQAFVVTSVGLQNQVMFPPVANKRYRIFTIDVTIGAFVSIPPANTPMDVGIGYNVETINSQDQIAIGRVWGGQRESQRSFPAGFDCPVGDGVQFDAQVDWGADGGITVIATAQLI